MPILGGGCSENPDIMFVFINPTSKNVSSSPSWNGPRIPFLGTKKVWKIFNEAGFLSDKLNNLIQSKKPHEWDVYFANEVINELKNNRLFFTNIVKYTGGDAALPDSNMISLFLPYFLREIEIVKPKLIVTFGLIPFKALTDEDIKLKDYYEEFIKRNIKYYSVQGIQLIPCYFPVGRGEPRKAIEMLKVVKVLV